MRIILSVISISLLLFACKSNRETLNVIELKYLGSKVIINNYDDDDYDNSSEDYKDSLFTIVKKGKSDTVIGFNLYTKAILKVSVVELFPEVYLRTRYKGSFSYINDSLILYVSTLGELNLNHDHNRIARLYNFKSKKLTFFNFDNLPVITDNKVLDKINSSNENVGSELVCNPWFFQYNALDSSMYVLLVKTLTAQDDLIYDKSDKFWIAKVNLKSGKNEKYKTIFPKFHSFGDTRHKYSIRPNSTYFANKIVIGYPVHLNIYQFDKDSKETKLLPVSSGLVPNELRFSDADSINAYNTGFIGVWKNQHGNGFFRVAQTESKALIGTVFKNYLDFRSILIWKKDNGDVAECYLDKPIWSVAYANNDTLYCTSKITNETKQLTLEKYLITGTKKVDKQKYLNQVLGVKP